MLFAMGAGDQVVGVSSYDRYPAAVASRERVGALIDPNVERIFALKPDLVVVYGTQQELIARLDRAGVPTFGYQHAGLADITLTIRRLGQRVGRGQEADRLAARIERDIEEIRQQVAGGPAPGPRLSSRRGHSARLYAVPRRILHAAGGGGGATFDDVRNRACAVVEGSLRAR